MRERKTIMLAVYGCLPFSNFACDLRLRKIARPNDQTIDVKQTYCITISRYSPMGNDRSPESQHEVWRHHILQCSKAVTLNLRQRSGLNSNTRYYNSSAYLQVLKGSELKWPRKPGKLYFQTLKGSLLHSQ